MVGVFAIYDAAQSTGFHISPGIQYVMNQVGNTKASNLFIYGIRLQTFFKEVLIGCGDFNYT